MTFETTAVTSFNSDSLLPIPSGTFEHVPTIRSRTIARKVLVVDDDAALRGLVADLLAFEGYFVTEAEDEKTLLALLQGINDGSEGGFDLIVLGLQAHGSLCIDSLIRLRELGCHTPAIVLAQQANAPVDRRMLELEASFLSKPLLLENLRIVANHVLCAGEQTQGRPVDLAQDPVLI
jgi:DNA-binding response OmpR family regulator